MLYQNRRVVVLLHNGQVLPGDTVFHEVDFAGFRGAAGFDGEPCIVVPLGNATPVEVAPAARAAEEVEAAPATRAEAAGAGAAAAGVGAAADGRACSLLRMMNVAATGTAAQGGKTPVQEAGGGGGAKRKMKGVPPESPASPASLAGKQETDAFAMLMSSGSNKKLMREPSTVVAPAATGATALAGKQVADTPAPMSDTVGTGGSEIMRSGAVHKVTGWPLAVGLMVTGMDSSITACAERIQAGSSRTTNESGLLAGWRHRCAVPTRRGASKTSCATTRRTRGGCRRHCSTTRSSSSRFRSRPS